jgi:colicin import membrane protein
MNGKGGSYVIDPKTGDHILVERTGASDDEVAREAANKAAMEKEAAERDAADKAEKAAADKAAKAFTAEALKKASQAKAGQAANTPAEPAAPAAQ